MEVIFNSYVRRYAADVDIVKDIIDVTINGDDVPDWEYSFSDDLGIADEVMEARTAWLESNEEPVYVVPPLSDETLAGIARGTRDALLSATDYLFYTDAPYSSETVALYRTYRQELRDVPQQVGFPQTIVWPDKP